MNDSVSKQSPGTVSVNLGAAPAPHALETQWRALEARADASYFTSWSWIGCWLQGLEPERRSQLQLLRATAHDGDVVGLALLLPHAGRRLKLLPSRSLYLHATGDHRHDDLAVEHNGLLVQREAAAEVAAAMYAHLISQAKGWDRIELPGLSAAAPLASLQAHGAVLREKVCPSHYVDLAAVRANGGDYLGLVSANTRSQIRRSLKAYAELGPVSVTQALDVDTALRHLDGLKALHQAHWTARGVRGAFANRLFEAFHRRQIIEGVPGGQVQMLRVHAGEHDIGYLYNFIHRGQVLFYQSGFDYELLAKHGRPGLVAHALAIQHNAALGHTAYDFLAGNTRYKQSLSSGVRNMVWSSVHRDTLAFRVEERLRALKRKLLRLPEPALYVPPGKREAEGPRISSLLLASILTLMQALMPDGAEASPSSSRPRPAETTAEAPDFDEARHGGWLLGAVA